MQSLIKHRNKRNPFSFVQPLGERRANLPTVGHDRISADWPDRLSPYSDLQTWVQYVRMADAIIAMTSELFPGRIRIETDIDPEFPDEKRHVVEVEASGEFRNILERELRWHDKLWELVGKPDGLKFGICIFPK